MNEIPKSLGMKLVDIDKRVDMLLRSIKKSINFTYMFN